MQLLWSEPSVQTKQNRQPARNTRKQNGLETQLVTMSWIATKYLADCTRHSRTCAPKWAEPKRYGLDGCVGNACWNGMMPIVR
eukprot:2933686-Amphidinium_carterae.1